MKQKNQQTLALVLVAILLIIFAVTFWQYRGSILKKKTAPATQISEDTVTDKTITDDTAPFKIAITYPAIAGNDGFNTEVQKAVNTALTTFKTNSLANGQTMKEINPADFAKNPPEYDLTIGYDKGQIDENIASVMLNVYEFEGGADGDSYFIPVNYDLKNNKDIALADVFSGKKNYLQEISAYCIADLKKQLTAAMEDNGAWVAQNGSEIQDGAGPKASNYQNFLINSDNTITVYFAQDQVSFHAAGSFKVVVPDSIVK